VPYGDVAGCDGQDVDCGGSQQLDIYRSPAPGVNPVILWLHGGGFVAGDKEGSLSAYVQPLLDEGWDVVSANYRLTTADGQNPYPTALMDAKRAVRWIKANAAAQGWDANAVAAMGHSAGGNLVEMLAVTADNPELEPQDLPPELQAVDSSIIAAVALAPVSDLETFVEQPMFTDAVHRYVACEAKCTKQLRAASPHTHVDSTAAPILAIHGADDPWAGPGQGEQLQQAYEDADLGDRFELIVVDDGPEEFRAHVPDLERWIEDISDFLDSHLPEGTGLPDGEAPDATTTTQATG
jgi:acetyl esterase/lipase